MSSPFYFFTKVLCPFTKRYRGIVIKAIIYIDDGIGESSSFWLAKTAGKLVKSDLVSAGFVFNVEKNDFNPKNQITICINIYNGYTFKPRAFTTCLIFTDASKEGYGSFILKHLNKEVFSAKFKDYEKQTSSAHRKLLAINYVLDSFGEML